MAETTDNASRNDQTDDLAASAAEGMLGPNPFVGLRPCDILATAQQIGTQALRQPALVLEQEAALVRELIAALYGGAREGAEASPKVDRRFADPARRDNSLYRITLQSYGMARRAWRICRALRAGSEIEGTRAVRDVAVHGGAVADEHAVGQS